MSVTKCHFLHANYTLHYTCHTEHASPCGSGHDDHGNGFLILRGVQLYHKGYGVYRICLRK
jgi:hypothetical protein